MPESKNSFCFLLNSINFVAEEMSVKTASCHLTGRLLFKPHPLLPFRDKMRPDTQHLCVRPGKRSPVH